MAKLRLDGQARKKLDGLITALNANNQDLAVQRARVLFGLLQSEDVVFALLPPKMRSKLRHYLNNKTASLAAN